MNELNRARGRGTNEKRYQRQKNAEWVRGNEFFLHGLGEGGIVPQPGKGGMRGKVYQEIKNQQFFAALRKNPKKKKGGKKKKTTSYTSEKRWSVTKETGEWRQRSLEG